MYYSISTDMLLPKPCIIMHHLSDPIAHDYVVYLFLFRSDGQVKYVARPSMLTSFPIGQMYALFCL